MNVGPARSHLLDVVNPPMIAVKLVFSRARTIHKPRGQIHVDLWRV